MITINMVTQNVFCPKFTYYDIVLGLERQEGGRGTVYAGKQYHDTTEKTNLDYIPKNLNGKKLTSQKLYSKNHGFVGIVDHAIESDNEIVVIERKYSDYRKISNKIKAQLGLLAILLEENFSKPVKRAHVIFYKNGSRTKIEVDINQDIRNYALDMLNNTKNVIEGLVMPDSSYDARCISCYYRKICDVGSLNSA